MKELLLYPDDNHLKKRLDFFFVDIFNLNNDVIAKVCLGNEVITEHHVL